MNKRNSLQPHPTCTISRLIYQINILFALLSIASCTAPSSSTPQIQLPPITADGSRLLSGSAPFEVRGVNYIHPSDADLSKCPALQFGADGNCPWNIAPIAADLDRLKALGVNTVRVFLNYYVFGGARAADPNYRMAQPLAHLDAFIAEANR
ncbi:MAG TPA: hypothetical protein VF909_07350, partial [Roseiflexaceae bacterium]